MCVYIGMYVSCCERLCAIGSTTNVDLSHLDCYLSPSHGNQTNVLSLAPAHGFSPHAMKVPPWWFERRCRQQWKDLGRTHNAVFMCLDDSWFKGSWILSSPIFLCSTESNHGQRHSRANLATSSTNNVCCSRIIFSISCFFNLRPETNFGSWLSRHLWPELGHVCHCASSGCLQSGRAHSPSALLFQSSVPDKLRESVHSLHVCFPNRAVEKHCESSHRKLLCCP